MSEGKIHIAWIHGSYHGRRGYMKALREKFADCDKFNSDNDISFEYLMTELQGTSCFNENKLVVINDMPNYKDSNKQKYLKLFKKILDDLDEDIFVVFNGISPKKERALFAHVEKLDSKVIEFQETLIARSAPEWVLKRLEEKGYSLDMEIAEAIVEANGYDASLSAIGVDMLKMAMIRIQNYLGKTKKKITLDVVAATATFQSNFVIWDMLNSIDKRDYERCLELLSRACLVNNNATSAVMQILNIMHWKFRLLWLLKDRISSTDDYTEAAKSALLIKKLKGTGTGMSRIMATEIVQTGENAGQPAAQWNKNAVREALEGRYGATPAIDLYSRRELYQIIWAIQSAIALSRVTTSENELLLLLNVVLMIVCKKCDYEYSRSIIKSYEETQI